MEAYHILIVEDDKEILDGVGIYMKNQGYEVFKAQNGLEGLKILEKEEIHLAIIDIMMPVMDGITMTMKLREHYDFPVIMLSAKSEEIDKVTGLNIGADDYVTKPFPMNELLARIKANIRRSSNDMLKAPVPDASAVIHIRGLEIDTTKCQVVRDGQTIELTKKEYELLTFMAKNEGTIYSREQLLGEVWGYDGFYGDTSSVDVTVSRLRSKLEKDAGKPEYLFTKRGMGYYIK